MMYTVDTTELAPDGQGVYSAGCVPWSKHWRTVPCVEHLVFERQSDCSIPTPGTRDGESTELAALKADVWGELVQFQWNRQCDERYDYSESGSIFFGPCNKKVRAALYSEAGGVDSGFPFRPARPIHIVGLAASRCANDGRFRLLYNMRVEEILSFGCAYDASPEYRLTGMPFEPGGRTRAVPGSVEVPYRHCDAVGASELQQRAPDLLSRIGELQALIRNKAEPAARAHIFPALFDGKGVERIRIPLTHRSCVATDVGRSYGGDGKSHGYDVCAVGHGEYWGNKCVWISEPDTCQEGCSLPRASAPGSRSLPLSQAPVIDETGALERLVAIASNRPD